MRISQTTSAIVDRFWESVVSDITQARQLEEAAQELATALYERFEESIVLSRVFVTVPFGELPPQNRDFVTGLVASVADSSVLKETTPILSLVGTYGDEDEWCDRHDSQGHVGIPLISQEFVGGIPMISRLLREFGVPIEFLDSHDADVIVETIGRFSGLFYVEDAAEVTDNQDRKIIAAQDFVSEYGVKTVFGVGGAYNRGQMLVIVAFCRDVFPRTTAAHFQSLVGAFRDQTSELAAPEKIFLSVSA